MNGIGAKGIKALLDTLGAQQTVWFLLRRRPGEGDYTRDRDQWLPPGDVDTILEMARQWEKEKKGQAGRKEDGIKGFLWADHYNL